MIPSMTHRVTLPFALLALALILAGCSGIKPRNAVPLELADTAEVPGITYARFWGDDVSPLMEQRVRTLTTEQVKDQFPALYGRPHNYLAISGGGARGAFGAGVLVGWTAAGNRPEFQMVTGISTGALIAPWAFIGPSQDHVLQHVYTSISTEDIAKMRSPLRFLFTDATADSAPLQELLRQLVDDEVIAAIAAEHRKGRRLYIGTTDLDRMRPRIWNIGRIAASGQPGAKDLVQKIMLASASIPGAFPPVRIRVEANGKSYEELHVDGGTSNQVFIYPAAINWRKVLELLNVPGKTNTYVLRNSALDVSHEAVEQKLLPIAGRSVSSLIRTQGIGDLFQIYLLTQRDGGNYHLAYIPDEFDGKSTEPFDTVYMNQLFDLGYELARKGYPWEAAPPGWFVETADD